MVTEVTEDGLDTGTFRDASIRWVIDTLEKAYQDGYRFFDISDYDDTQFFHFAKKRPETKEERILREDREETYALNQKQREMEWAKQILAKYGEPTNQ
jgi:hypothetical protein